MKRLRKFLHLATRDRQLLFNAVFIIGIVRLGLWLLPFQIWRHLIAETRQTTHKRQNTDQSVDKVVWAVAVASRYMPGEVKCLARALATQVLLAQRGYRAQLHIGVAKSKEGHLEAHAWVESQGRVVVGGLKDLGRYTPLPTLEAET